MARVFVYIVVMLAVMAALDYLFYERLRPMLGFGFVLGLVIIIIQELRKSSKGKPPTSA